MVNLETAEDLASSNSTVKKELSPAKKKTEKRLPPTLLSCKPTHFDVNYKINPWMRPAEWQTNRQKLFEKAIYGWQKMHDLFIHMNFSVQLVDPQPGIPDMVFTANAAIVLDGKALLSRYRFTERQPEEEHFKKYFEQAKEKGLVSEVASLPAGLKQEGAGDCVWDPTRRLFWAGYGPRSDKEAAQFVGDYFATEVIPLELATSEFYHLDVCLCALSGGHIMYYPGAFSEKSQALIKERIGSNFAIEVEREDAELFALNAVNFESRIVLGDCSEKLERQLKDRGYEVFRVPVGVFNMAGGSVWCLALRLDHHR
jgi:N-dimethylarginine dimethylaminohydrolase